MPNNIAIVAGGGNTNINNANPFDSSDDGALLGVDLLTGALTGGASVTVTTGTAGGDSEPGNLTLSTPLDFEGTGTNSLSLNAANDILINQPITDSTAGGDNLNLRLVADDDSSGVGNIMIAPCMIPLVMENRIILFQSLSNVKNKNFSLLGLL